ncbi:MAG: PorP/SprF family type IX secretion system membrane protein [Bacteroidetes bacterium]|nr:PorP/SprF family type IX secretion system membrane protein [Bacteroidota bacterium]
MKSKQLTLLASLLCVLGASPLAGYAQVDPHFSQYYSYPQALNPALTGAMEGDYRITAMWRSQYGNMLSTKGMAADFCTSKNVNLGFNLLNQSTADHVYSFTNGYVSMSYTGVRFGPDGDQYLAMALQGGFIGRRIDPTKLQFDDQWVQGVGYNPSNPTADIISSPSVSSFDAGAGIAYYDARPDNDVNIFAGLSAFHLTRPQDPFLSAGSKQRLPIRYSLNGGARIQAGEGIAIVPNGLYVSQGNATETMVGMYVQLFAAEGTDFMVGTNWRINDAVTPYAGIYYNGLTVGVSYDVNISPMAAAAKGMNSIEISLAYIGISKKRGPRNYFKCPRF